MPLMLVTIPMNCPGCMISKVVMHETKAENVIGRTGNVCDWRTCSIASRFSNSHLNYLSIINHISWNP